MRAETGRLATGAAEVVVSPAGIEVAHHVHQLGPPDTEGIVPHIAGFVWDRFTTGKAVAFVLHTEGAPVFLLHAIDSTRPGHGSAILWAIGEWADALRIRGSLVCSTELVDGFYAPHGWRPGSAHPALTTSPRALEAAGMVELRRDPPRR